MKIFSKKEVAPMLVIFLMLVLAVSLWKAPCVQRVPTHWNAAGQIDGWASKEFVVLFFPLLTIGLYLLMLFLPKIDPLKKNYQSFEKPYYFIRLMLVLLFAGLFVFTFLTAGGLRVNIIYFIAPFMALLFFVLGYFMPKIKRNWFVGIKTPWTLQSDKVWEKTHKFGGKCFLAMAGLTFLTVFLPSELSFLFFLAIIIFLGFLPVAYSYFVFKKGE